MRRRGLYLGVFYLNLFCSAASAAAFATKRSRRPVVAAENRRSLFFWRDDDSAVSNPQLNYRSSATILGESSSNNYNRNSRDAVPGGGSGSLVTQANVAAGRNQLLTAFTNLGLNDQYDAVLTGLCAKLLDSAATTTTILASSLVDCTDLLQEMNEQKIAASPRSLMALIDVRTLTCLLWCFRHSGVLQTKDSLCAFLLLFWRLYSKNRYVLSSRCTSLSRTPDIIAVH